MGGDQRLIEPCFNFSLDNQIICYTVVFRYIFNVKGKRVNIRGKTKPLLPSNAKKKIPN